METDKRTEVAPLQGTILFPNPNLVTGRLPNDERRDTLQEFMYMIGEDAQFPTIWQEVENFVPGREPVPERMGYSKEQRLWVKFKRDQGLDLAPYPHLTDEQRELHHIWALGFLQAYLGLSNHPELMNSPHNGITLSHISHSGPYIPGVNHSRHPDVHSAAITYRSDPEAYKKTFEQHRNLAIEGIKYWVSGDDSELARIATERTMKMRALREERLRQGLPITPQGGDRRDKRKNHRR